MPPPHADWAAGPAEPDRPLSFGSRTRWFAIRTEEGRAVADSLALKSVRQANWETGLAWAADSRWAGAAPPVFVTPPIDGWTLVVGAALPCPDEGRLGAAFRRTLQALTARFDDVQFFANHPVADHAAWARARDGAVVRVFAWAGDEGRVLANEGRQTFEERLLGLLDLGERTPEAAAGYINERIHDDDEKPAPDPQDVMSLAGHWSVDPTGLGDRGLLPGLGLIGRLAG
jgi:hypothetical protein